MKKRVILYILSVIGIVILNCLYVNFEFMVMLVMVIVIPLFSYIILMFFIIDSSLISSFKYESITLLIAVDISV